MKILSKAMTLSIKGYQMVISPLLGSNCRFHPTCSAYCIEAIEIWGPAKGGMLCAKRIGKCHPWGSHGIDLVPKRKKKE